MLSPKPHNKFQNGTFGICNAYNLYVFKEFINKPTKHEEVGVYLAKIYSPGTSWMLPGLI